MKKNTRRKKAIGEFAHYGFEVSADWTFYIPEYNSKYALTPETTEKIEKTWYKIIDFCEARSLTCGGGSNEENLWFIFDKYSKNHKFHENPTNADKESLIELLNSIDEITNISIGEWIDLYYPNRKHAYKG